MRKQMFYIATAVYFVAAVAFFVLPPSLRNIWICFPTWLLMLFCAVGGDKRARIASVALTASAVGDVFGGMGALLPQIGSFAVAQIVYALLFCRYVRWDVRRLPLLLLPVAVAVVVSMNVVPSVDGVLRVAIVGYMVVILLMSVCAIFVHSRLWWLLSLGAFVFVLSDSIIAWNIFVERIPNAIEWIMSTYYVAQGLLGLTLLRGALSASEE